MRHVSACSTFLPNTIKVFLRVFELQSGHEIMITPKVRKPELLFLHATCRLVLFYISTSRPPPRGRFGRRSHRNSYDFALSVPEREDDFALFFGDFLNILSVLLAPVSRFFACLQQTLKKHCCFNDR